MTDKTLSVRYRTADVRRPDGVSYLVTYVHCTCPDFLWRDISGKMHYCKHIVHVYATYVRQMKHGERTFRVPSFATPGVVYTVTVFHCPCPDYRPGVLELCEHLKAAYQDRAGFNTPAAV
jgi:hypothetical protein